jgi:hypothetical protein
MILSAGNLVTFKRISHANMESYDMWLGIVIKSNSHNATVYWSDSKVWDHDIASLSKIDTPNAN